jgi:hypothetical protein
MDDKMLDALLREDRDGSMTRVLADRLLQARPKPAPWRAAWVPLAAAAALAAVAGAAALQINRASSLEEELWISVDGALEVAAPAEPAS